jgi:hypothetical protein
MSSFQRGYCPVVAALCLAASLASQSVHATQVVAFDDRGGAGGGVFARNNLLGAPNGTVCSLGAGGFVTLQLGVTMVDGPGADFIVAENAFFAGAVGHAFSEVFFVEVSSNGADFARVPAAYYGPRVSPGAFGTVATSWYAGLAGVCPSFRNGDLQDVVEAGGDAFDLAVLRTHPLVVANRVQLNAITQVRFVDAVDGVDLDARGVVVQDPGSPGSADVDGITVIHHTGSVTASHPTVDVGITASGVVTVTLSDPDGLADLDPTSLRASLYGIQVDAIGLLAAFVPTQVTPTSLTFALGGVLPPWLSLRMSISVKDRSGQRSGATAVRPDR